MYPLKKLWSHIIYVEPVTYTNEEVADIIQAFLDGKGGPYDWDDFCTHFIPDPELDEIRLRCLGLNHEFPPGEAGGYCGPDGIEVLEGFVKQLRKVLA